MSSETGRADRWVNGLVEDEQVRRDGLKDVGDDEDGDDDREGDGGGGMRGHFCELGGRRHHFTPQ